MDQNPTPRRQLSDPSPAYAYSYTVDLIATATNRFLARLANQQHGHTGYDTFDPQAPAPDYTPCLAFLLHLNDSCDRLFNVITTPKRRYPLPQGQANLASWHLFTEIRAIVKSTIRRLHKPRPLTLLSKDVVIASNLNTTALPVKLQRELSTHAATTKRHKWTLWKTSITKIKHIHHLATKNTNRTPN